MRVFIFAERGHGSTVVETLREADVEIVGVCGSAPPSKLRALKTKIARLVVREGWPYRDPFENYADPSSLGLPFLDRADMDKVSDYLANSNVDLILCCSFPKLIPNAVLQTARHAINIHPGLLPERPGGTPNRWAIRLGDGKTGVTAHYMTDRFDAGDIVFRKEIEISGDADWGEVELSLAPLIKEAARFIVDRLTENDALPRQPNAVTKTQRSLRGKELDIVWTQSGDEIRRQCLAARPKIGARTMFRGKTLILWSVQPSLTLASDRIPGTVINIDSNGCPTVALAEKTILIKEVLYRGKVHGAGYLKFRVGERFS